MKFECEKSMLASAIEGVSRAITNRAAIPVLEGIYMKAEGFNLTLTGYDMCWFPARPYWMPSCWAQWSAACPPAMSALS